MMEELTVDERLQLVVDPTHESVSRAVQGNREMVLRIEERGRMLIFDLYMSRLGLLQSLD